MSVINLGIKRYIIEGENQKKIFSQIKHAHYFNTFNHLTRTIYSYVLKNIPFISHSVIKMILKPSCHHNSNEFDY